MKRFFLLLAVILSSSQLHTKKIDPQWKFVENQIAKRANTLTKSITTKTVSFGIAVALDAGLTYGSFKLGQLGANVVSDKASIYGEKHPRFLKATDFLKITPCKKGFVKAASFGTAGITILIGTLLLPKVYRRLKIRIRNKIVLPLVLKRFIKNWNSGKHFEQHTPTTMHGFFDEIQMQYKKRGWRYLRKIGAQVYTQLSEQIKTQKIISRN